MSASRCLFGKLASATLCTLSRVHHSLACPATSSTLPGTYLLTAFLAPSRHLPFVSLTIATTFSSAFFALSTAALAGLDGITDRKSSGMCDAPASAVSDTAAASGPSDANVSSAARRGDVRAGLNTGVCRRGVAGTGSGKFCLL